MQGVAPHSPQTSAFQVEVERATGPWAEVAWRKWAGDGNDTAVQECCTRPTPRPGPLASTEGALDTLGGVSQQHGGPIELPLTMEGKTARPDNPPHSSTRGPCLGHCRPAQCLDPGGPGACEFGGLARPGRLAPTSSVRSFLVTMRMPLVVFILTRWGLPVC